MKNQNKKLWSAFFLTFLIPGLGHYRIGQLKKGLIFFLIGLSLNLLYVHAHYYALGNQVLEQILTPVLLAFVIFIAIDAIRSSSEVDLNLKKGWPKVFGIVLLVYGVAIGIAICIRVFFAQPFKIPTDTMAPTLIKKDRFMVDKWAYRFSNPQRGDVIVFIYPKDRKRTFVKRVVGLPQEKIEIKDGKIYVNGQLLNEPPVFNQITYKNLGIYGGKGEIIDVPAGHYFVLGDNSTISHDGRYWGFVPRVDIIGRAYKIFEPSERNGPIR